jgi:hypothetical protein
VNHRRYGSPLHHWVDEHTLHWTRLNVRYQRPCLPSERRQNAASVAYSRRGEILCALIIDNISIASRLCVCMMMIPLRIELPNEL